MAQELDAAEQVLYTKLAADAALTALVGTRIYAYSAPQNPTYPFVVFSVQAGGPDRSALGGANRVVARPLYLVKAVGAPGDGSVSFVNAGAIANALDAVVQGMDGQATISGTTYRVQTLGRETPVRYLETREGLRYPHAGGLYRLWVQSL